MADSKISMYAAAQEAQSHASLGIVLIVDIVLWVMIIAADFLGWYYSPGLWYHIFHLVLIVVILLVTTFRVGGTQILIVALGIGFVVVLIDTILLPQAIAFFYQCFANNLTCPNGADITQYTVYTIASFVFFVLGITATSSFFALHNIRLSAAMMSGNRYVPEY